jgi:hypothetical protein
MSRQYTLAGNIVNEVLKNDLSVAVAAKRNSFKTVFSNILSSENLSSSGKVRKLSKILNSAQFVFLGGVSASS